MQEVRVHFVTGDLQSILIKKIVVFDFTSPVVNDFKMTDQKEGTEDAIFLSPLCSSFNTNKSPHSAI